MTASEDLKNKNLPIEKNDSSLDKETSSSYSELVKGSQKKYSESDVSRKHYQKPTSRSHAHYKAHLDDLENSTEKSYISLIKSDSLRNSFEALSDDSQSLILGDSKLKPELYQKYNCDFNQMIQRSYVPEITSKPLKNYFSKLIEEPNISQSRLIEDLVTIDYLSSFLYKEYADFSDMFNISNIPLTVDETIHAILLANKDYIVVEKIDSIFNFKNYEELFLNDLHETNVELFIKNVFQIDSSFISSYISDSYKLFVINSVEE